MTPVYQHILNELQGAVRLAVRGAARELTQLHNVPSKEVDILTLNAVVCEVDSLADLPTLTFSDMIIAIRASVENEHAEDKEENCEHSDVSTTIDGHVGHLMTVQEFKDDCWRGVFNDYDGSGDLVKDGAVIVKRIDDSWIVKPSNRHAIPDDITHILWYNT